MCLAPEAVLTIVVSATDLAGAYGGVIYEYDDASRKFRVSASHRMTPEHLEAVRATLILLGEDVVGQAGQGCPRNAQPP
jgi:hypothetical protein